jgi:3-deoxy-D-manno-octulosonate 8-phosphate phosphatase (KDO 8-P phosphatase)
MQSKINLSIKNKCKKIKIILTDVDGVLTDGGRYYSEKGEILKKFHVRDGMGVNILLRNGIKTIIVTKENSKITKKWAKDMNVTKIISGSLKKENELVKICKIFKLSPTQIAYIGDDVNDIGLLKKVGFSATTNDADNMIKENVDYVCTKDGGNGAFREISDIIFKEKFSSKKKLY